MLDWDDAVPSLPWTPAKETQATTLKTPPPAFRKMQSRSSIKCENVGPWEHHEQSHHDPTCDKCVYARKRRFWMKLTPLDDASGCNTTWMCAKPLGTPDSEWGLGVPLLPEPPSRFIGNLDLVLLAPSRVGAVAVVAHLLRLSSPCSIPNMGV